MMICYHPGARGDFLGRVLTDSMPTSSEQNTFLTPAAGIGRCHFPTIEILSSSKTSCIRISPTTDLDILYIAFYHHRKNRQLRQNPSTPYAAQNFYDQLLIDMRNIHYDSVKYAAHREKFDYWVEFSELCNIDSVFAIYEKVRGCGMVPEQIEATQYNIGIQDKIDDLNLFKLLILFSYEKTEGLLEHARMFSITDYLDSTTPSQWLNTRYYQVANHE